MSEIESINPNTPVTSNLTKNGTIETDSTGGPLSFDELEEVTMATRKAKTDKKESKPQEKSKDLTSDTDKGKSPQSKTEKEPAGKESSKAKPKNESDDGDEETLTASQARKLIKAKLADSEFDLDEEALIPVKINGKEEMIPVRDLMGNYSGKTAWDKKFSELDQTRKQISARELKMNEISKAVKDLFEEQDPNIKMYRMAQISGLDPIEFREKFFNDNISLLEKWYSMSEDERKADALAYESNVHKHRADTLERSIRDQQEMQSLNSKVEQLRASHNISEREFVDMYDQFERMVQSGQMPSNNVTPENIIEGVRKTKIFNAAAESLQKYDLGWNQQQTYENLKRLTDSAYDLGLSPDDMAESVDELWGSKRAARKLEEKRKDNQEFLTGKKPVAQAKKESSEVWSFEQI